MANALSNLYTWDAQALKEMQGLHPKKHSPRAMQTNVEKFITAINSAVDEFAAKKRAEDRFAAVQIPSPEELVEAISPAAKKSIANALAHALADAGFYGGAVFPNPLPGGESHELYPFLAAFVRNPETVGLTDSTGISEFRTVSMPDVEDGEAEEADA